MTKPGEPCWIELFTPDTDAAADFYGRLFGWTATEPDEAFGGYRMFLRGDEPIAGLMRNDGTMGGPNAWTVYLEHRRRDEDRRAGRGPPAREVVAGPMQVGDLGHMAVLVDPAGATVGAWQPLSFAGLTVEPEDGAPVWFETLSNGLREVRRVLRRRVRMGGRDDERHPGVPVHDARQGRRRARRHHGRQRLPAATQPSRWQFYVQVPDTDATVEQAVASGATLVQPAEDTPYGRLAVLADPAGAQFNVMGPNKQAT